MELSDEKHGLSFERSGARDFGINSSGLLLKFEYETDGVFRGSTAWKLVFPPRHLTPQSISASKSCALLLLAQRL